MSDDTDSFDCNDASLNEYLKRYALKNQERHMYGVTYVALPTEAKVKILGYYTVSNCTIPRGGLPEHLTKGQPKYNEIPALLLGRLAVDKDLRGTGIGHALMAHCLDMALNVAKWSGARYLITDAYDATISWYERYNFRAMVGSNSMLLTKMYVDLKVVREARLAVIPEA